MNKPDSFTENLRKASVAMFLATDEGVAKDISNKLVGAAEHIETLQQRIKHLEAECERVVDDQRYSIKKYNKANKRVKEYQSQLLMSRKDLCQKHNIQMCHDCNDLDCGDNLNPFKAHHHSI